MRLDQGQASRIAARSVAGTELRPAVFIVDDDQRVREGLAELIQSAGYEPLPYASVGELLASGSLKRPGCLILDVRLPGASGLDIQQQLARGPNPKPVIFLTGHGDIPMTVQAMKAGAIDFLTKPVRDQTLLDAIATGIAHDADQRTEAEMTRQHLDRVATLTPRELEVLDHVASGWLNKQIAFDLGISEVTVKLHRSNAMRKMGLSSIAQLVRVWSTNAGAPTYAQSGPLAAAGSGPMRTPTRPSVS